MDNILLHDISRYQLKNLIKHPSHAILITGVEGSGKRTAGRMLASRLLEVDEEALDSYPYFTHMYPEGQSEITIDAVRQLLRRLSLKTPGAKAVRRIVLIERGDRMSIEAQNAILKILEEPGNGVVFLITATAKNRVLPTIASRAQHVHLQPVPLRLVRSHFGNQYSSKQLDSSWRLSQGAAGMLYSLLKDDTDHPLKKAVDQSKKFLRLKKYDRLLFLESISANKADFKLFLDALSRVIGALHEESINSHSRQRQKKLLSCRQLLQELDLALGQNISHKLATLKLVMNLGV